jgi:hypothetical protein
MLLARTARMRTPVRVSVDRPRARWLFVAALVLAGQARPAAAIPEPPRPSDEFLAHWKDLPAKLAKRGLDDLLFPGGHACDNSDAAMEGRRSSTSISPDGKSLAVITTVRLDAKTAKKLGISGDAPDQETTVAVLLDGPKGTIWSDSLPGGGACDRADSKLTWSADSRRVYVVAAVGVRDDTHGALIDAAARKIVAAGLSVAPAPSPDLRHLAAASWPDSERLRVDEDDVWGSPDAHGSKVSAIRWLSDTRVGFCGSVGKGAPEAYTADLGTGDKVTVTKVGPCK